MKGRFTLHLPAASWVAREITLSTALGAEILAGYLQVFALGAYLV